MPQKKKLRVRADEKYFYEAENKSGYDIRIGTDVDISPSYVMQVNTNIYVEIPKGFIGLITLHEDISERGVALMGGIHVLPENHKGPIILNLTSQTFSQTIFRFTTVARLFLIPVQQMDLIYVEDGVQHETSRH